MERRGGRTRGQRPGGARGVRGAAAHVRVGSVRPPDATIVTLATTEIEVPCQAKEDVVPNDVSKWFRARADLLGAAVCVLLFLASCVSHTSSASEITAIERTPGRIQQAPERARQSRLCELAGLRLGSGNRAIAEEFSGEERPWSLRALRQRGVLFVQDRRTLLVCRESGIQTCSLPPGSYLLAGAGDAVYVGVRSVCDDAVTSLCFALFAAIGCADRHEVDGRFRASILSGTWDERGSRFCFAADLQRRDPSAGLVCLPSPSTFLSLRDAGP
jgi:hypothetical protein